jgi:glycosyltransferase involved in cell wall biosynthesis
VRLGIDATPVAPNSKGLGRFLEKLLSAIAPFRGSHEIVVFVESSLAASAKDRWPGFTIVPARVRNGVLWERLTLPRLAKRHRLDALLTGRDRTLLPPEIPTVIYLFEVPDYRTEMELRPESGAYARAAAIHTRRRFRNIAGRVSRFLVSSESTAHDLREKYGVLPGRIEVIPPGIDANRFRPVEAAERENIRRRLTNGRPYVLHFSTGDPRDNSLVALEAFSRAAADGGAALLVVGVPPRLRPEIAAAAERLGIGGRVVVAGRLDENELVEAYQGAEAYLDPTLYEGFGFQLAEAMACGAPVVSSSVTSVPELVGDAGLLAEPGDIAGFGDALTRLLADGALRRRLGDLGRQRALRLRWEEASRRIIRSVELCVAPEKLMVLTEIVSPYRIPVFNCLADSLGQGLKVLFMGKTSSNRRWRVPTEAIRFDYEVLKGFRFRGPSWLKGFDRFVNPGVCAAIRRFRPSLLVIGGYHHPTSLLALRCANRESIPVYLWSESTDRDWRSGSRMVERVKRAFVRRCDGVLVPGAASRTYIERYTAPDQPIETAPNSAESPDFSAGLGAAEGERAATRRRWGLEGFTAIFVGRLSREKGLARALDVLEICRHDGLDATLLVVGDGPERRRHETSARRLGIRAVFTGFAQPRELPALYAAADVALVPSESEPWGLVVNEAMACGLPVLCTMEVGSGKDLVEDGRTGYRCATVTELAARMRELAVNEQLRAAIGKQCREMAARFSARECADGFLRALRNRNPAPEAGP